MAFGDFTFPQVIEKLSLTLIELELFPSAAAISVRPEFQEQLELGASIALMTSTDKARSEFLIAPVLLELRRIVGDRLGLFSGVPLEGDPDRGLSGVCDFVLTMSSRQLMLSAPLLAVVEAKNDNVLSGLGQCIASMVAARLINERATDLASTPAITVYGAVTTGSTWRFLRLTGSDLVIDRKEHYINALGELLGLLLSMVQSASVK